MFEINENSINNVDMKRVLSSRYKKKHESKERARQIEGVKRTKTECISENKRT